MDYVDENNLEIRTPFDMKGLRSEEIQAYLMTFNELSNRFNAKVNYGFKLNFRKFSLFDNHYILNRPIPIDVSNGKNISHIFFTKVEYRYVRKGPIAGTDCQAWGATLLPKDFGHVLIKSESLGDMLREILLPVELDFEDDPRFSKKFYVISDNKELALSAMNSSFRNAVSEIERKDFLIEITNNFLIIGNRKVVEPESTVCFAKFLNHVASLR